MPVCEDYGTVFLPLTLNMVLFLEEILLSANTATQMCRDMKVTNEAVTITAEAKREVIAFSSTSSTSLVVARSEFRKSPEVPLAVSQDVRVAIARRSFDTIQACAGVCERMLVRASTGRPVHLQW